MIDARTHLVVAYEPSIVLRGCVMRVSEAGRQRGIREGQRNVHALIRGEATERKPRGRRKRITYNPFRAPTFVDMKGQPVHSAAFVSFEPDGSAWVSAS